MELRRLVEVSATVAATRSRTRKIAALADLLRDSTGRDRSLAVAFLTGAPPQGRIGVGWATVAALRVGPADAASLRLGDVDRALAAVAGIDGTGSRDRRRDVLVGLLARATADEQAFLRRLLLGELRHGALDGVMVEAVAEAAAVPSAAVRRAYMLSDDLAAVAAAAFAGGRAALEAFRLRLFRPVQPMLAQTAEDVAAAVDGLTAAGDGAVVDAKIDGMRVQVHRLDDTVAVYTRSLRVVTDEMPAVVATARSLPAASVILDGEAVRFDRSGRPAPFQETMSGSTSGAGPTPGSRSTSGSTVDGDVSPLAVRFFDCLHHDGVDLLDEPLSRRLEALDGVVPDDHRVPRRVTDDPRAATTFFDEVVAAGFEGVVVKAPGSTYAAGRRGAAWRKVKPHHTLDLVVLAVEWGSGRRRGWLSNLHLGARDPAGGFVMLGKTFKGLTDELLAWQTEQLSALETHRDGHVVHVEPSLVVEIAFDGVQTSTRYPGGVALRFARVKRYRTYKTAAEADTIAQVRRLRR